MERQTIQKLGIGLVTTGLMAATGLYVAHDKIQELDPFDISTNRVKNLEKNKESAKIIFFNETCKRCQGYLDAIHEADNKAKNVEYINYAKQGNKKLFEKYNIQSFPTIVDVGKDGSVKTYPLKTFYNKGTKLEDLTQSDRETLEEVFTSREKGE